MIAETTIDTQLTRLEGSDFSADLRDLSEAQPYLVDYLSREDTGAFTENEQELLFFAVLVIYHAIKEERKEPALVEGDAIAEAEEHIFSLLQEQSARAFRERLDVFFTQTKEEDLLAFIEDLLVVEEESGVTKEGREPLFVLLKTCMDVLLQAAV
ncbi:MAG: hypothetical protein AAFU67_06110 [Bacteroidota bacterium]